MRTVLAVLCLSCAICLPAHAQAADGASAAGPQIMLEGTGERIEGSATVRIHASRKVVFALLGSCPMARRIVPGLETCEVRARAPDGSWARLWQVMDYARYLPRVRIEVLARYVSPASVAFERVDGDAVTLSGAWTLESAGDYTVAHYTFVFEPSYWVPHWILRSVIGRDLPRMLESLRAVAESQTGPNLG